MKGPGLRIDIDVRRVWRCPACATMRRTSGEVTTLRCSCKPGGTLMQPVEWRRRDRPIPQAVDPYIEIDLDAPVDEESAPSVVGVDKAADAATGAAGPAADGLQQEVAHDGAPRRRDAMSGEPGGPDVAVEDAFGSGVLDSAAQDPGTAASGPGSARSPQGSG